MSQIDISTLDYKAMKTLVRIVDLGSMSDAAHDLGVTQSTVSHTVDRLRNILQDPLFYRAGRRVAPTEHLLRTVSVMRTVLAEMEGLPNSHTVDRTRYRGAVTIAGNVTEFLPEFLALRDILAESMPHAQARFIELGSRGGIETLLTSGGALLAITARLPNYPAQIMSEPLLSDGFRVFYDPRERAPVETLVEYCAAPHAVLDFGGDAPSTVDMVLVRAGLERQVRVGVPNVSCLAAFVKGTTHIATMQSRLGKSALSGLASCAVPFDLGQVHFDLAWHRRNAQDPMVSALRTWMKAAASMQACPVEREIDLT